MTLHEISVYLSVIGTFKQHANESKSLTNAKNIKNKKSTKNVYKDPSLLTNSVVPHLLCSSTSLDTNTGCIKISIFFALFNIHQRFTSWLSNHFVPRWVISQQILNTSNMEIRTNTNNWSSKYQITLIYLSKFVFPLPKTFKLFGFAICSLLSLPVERYSRKASCTLIQISVVFFYYYSEMEWNELSVRRQVENNNYVLSNCKLSSTTRYPQDRSFTRKYFIKI